MRSEKEIRFGLAVAQLLIDSLNKEVPESESDNNDLALTKEALVWVLGEDEQDWFSEVVKDFRKFLHENT